MAKLTEFGKEVRKALIDRERDLSWLAEEVRTTSGMYCDPSYLSKIMNGKRNPTKLMRVVAEILEIAYGENQ